DDLSWALRRVEVAANDLDLYRIDYDADGLPLGGELVFHDPGPSFLSHAISNSGHAAFVVDDDDDDVYQLRYVEVLPEVSESVVVTDLEFVPPLKFDMHLDDSKLV